MIIDRRKFTTKITLYGLSSFYSYRWNQFKVIGLACTLGTKTSQILCDVRHPFTSDMTSRVISHHVPRWRSKWAWPDDVRVWSKRRQTKTAKVKTATCLNILCILQHNSLIAFLNCICYVFWCIFIVFLFSFIFLSFSLYSVYGLYIKQGIALTGRNSTGPPSRVTP